ncbi:Hypothetical predicted protein [Pelobates cultripes]|uniref:Uncharacterized protein n=1 Tax=Pelobates cultripes TaxID=61616 RepID=A0AAD1T653_PELCU|nr:Hypothetical predicted protein [Pelobates cultripes]
MVDLHSDSFQSSTTVSDEDIDLSEPPSPPHRYPGHVQRQPEPLLASKSDLSIIVSDLKAFFASELVLLEDLGTLKGRIKATEEDIQDLRIIQDFSATQTTSALPASTLMPVLGS